MSVDGAAAIAVLNRRQAPGLSLVTNAGAVAAACSAMAARFQAGGRLLVFGNGTSATDAAHIAVEFVHPVIVGKRALPAMSLAIDAATLTGVALRDGFDDVFAAQLRLHGQPADIALGLSADARCGNVLRALQDARQRGMLTVAMVGARTGPIATSPAIDHVLLAETDDPLIVKEVQVTTYHILWELVHVFFEQGNLAGAEAAR